MDTLDVFESLEDTKVGADIGASIHISFLKDVCLQTTGKTMAKILLDFTTLITADGMSNEMRSPPGQMQEV